MTVYERTMIAASKNKGLRLSSDEVFSLSQDDAIQHRALMDKEDYEEPTEKDKKDFYSKTNLENK